jgi:asparagine synthetase B (glutamine-hydrolysing)
VLTIIDGQNLKSGIEKAKLPAGYNLEIIGAGSIAVTRDFFSSDPIFYAVDKSKLLLADAYQELIGYLNSSAIETKPDLEYIKFYITFQAPLTSRTLTEEINLIRPGERLVLSSNGKFEKEFLSRNTDNESKYTQSELRNSIESILETINPDNTTFHISSGLDSSILAITAARIYPQSVIRLATCETLGKGCTDELVNSKRLADDIGAEIIIYDFSDIDVFKEGEELVRNCLGYPIAHPSHLVEYMLNKKIAATGVETIINGKGPDDCLAGYPWHLDAFEQPLDHKNRLMITSERELIELTGGLLNPQAGENYWEGINHLLSLKQRLEYDVRSLTEAWNIIHGAIAGYLGVNIISPFMEPKIRSGFFALDNKLKINNGQQKYFLRQAFMQDYPDYILNFAKHGLRLDLRPYFLEYDRIELFSKITCDVSLVEKYFNVKNIQKMIDDTLQGKKNYGWQLWSVFCVITALQR